MTQSYFDEEGPGEHDGHLLDHDAGENDTAPCPECGAELLAMADCCHRCGAMFGKEVWLAQGEGRWPRLWVGATVLVLIAFFAWLVL